MPIFLTTIGTEDAPHTADAMQIREREAAIRDDKAQISRERPEGVVERIHRRGRMTAEERVRALCDDGQPWLLREYEGFTHPQEGHAKPWRLGVLCAMGTVCRRKVVMIANDNTITAGAWWPGTPEKIVHALEMAKRLHIPVIYLIESAGLYLPHQDLTYAGSEGAGHIFQTQAQLSRAGIVQLAVIMGDCIAGGGYMPLMCDKIAMTESATMCIGGREITSHSKGGVREALGTAAVHVHLSGCAECRVTDDRAALEKLREWVSLLPSSACDFYRLDGPLEALGEPQDLYSLIPADPSASFEMREVLARLVDGAQIQNLEPDLGREIIAALAFFHGLPAVIIANNPETSRSKNDQWQAGGILYLEGIAKIRRVVSDAQSDGIPVIWILDVAGFDVGAEAEKQGLLRHGAMILREIADESTAPHLTILLRKASGAGLYAMKGSPFHPAMTLATAISRIEVMSPETLAGTLFDRKLSALAAEDPRRSSIEAQKKATIDAQRLASTPQRAAMRGDVDDIVELSSLRDRIIDFLEAAWQSPSHAVKPVRLWSLLQNEAVGFASA